LTFGNSQLRILRFRSLLPVGLRGCESHLLSFLYYILPPMGSTTPLPFLIKTRTVTSARKKCVTLYSVYTGSASPLLPDSKYVGLRCSEVIKFDFSLSRMSAQLSRSSMLSYLQWHWCSLSSYSCSFSTDKTPLHLWFRLPPSFSASHSFLGIPLNFYLNLYVLNSPVQER
jgi:hypothetical protein